MGVQGLPGRLGNGHTDLPWLRRSQAVCPSPHHLGQGSSFLPYHRRLTLPPSFPAACEFTNNDQNELDRSQLTLRRPENPKTRKVKTEPGTPGNTGEGGAFPATDISAGQGHAR